jgi:hypothetical protein
MNCAVCEKKNLTSATVLPDYGAACSEKCYKVLKTKREAYLDELRAETLGVIPEELDVRAFERFVLKFALHFLRDLNPKSKAKLKRSCPMILIPEELALEFKDRLLKHIPLFYVSSLDATGHERMFHGGVYQFKCAVPSKVVIEAFKKAELIEKRA